MSLLHLANHDGVVHIPVVVQPSSSRNLVSGIYGDRLKVMVTAPPEKGKANKAVSACMSKWLALPKSSCVVASGLTSRQKRVDVTGMSIADIEHRIEAL